MCCCRKGIGPDTWAYHMGQWRETSLISYKDLMYEVRADGHQPNWMITTQYTSVCDVWSSYAFKKKQEQAQRNCLQGRGGQGPSKHNGGSRSFIEWGHSTVLAHNLQPSPPSDREAAVARDQFRRYLL
ncbi:hypothetical protein M9H77_17188 [Catharanthus roseus]|uniref:Uncharacterized protein n=1 Tax=Catharanthus roseus TaxID=4058 RepID=A0ACC0B3X1_CATRO|nr:hypothetical protein M9H77_17188 [Catharanthus roseus]